ncbi:MAG: amino acid adenylation domain-containing protein, partial [Ignavibacteriales bacterium]
MAFVNDTGLDPELRSGDEIKDEAFVFPASYAQQRLWFLDQFEPGSPYYNIPSALRIKGKFNVEILNRVIKEICRRHESLRTNFSTIDGKPVQVISLEINIPFSIIDLTEIPAVDVENEISHIVNETARYSFNLSNEPLFRVKVLKISSEDHVLIVIMHHIISDGWSMGVLIDEITKLYAAFTEGKSSPLQDLEIQYADYSQWQKDYLEGELLDQQLDYWKKQLGNTPFLELPTDRPRPAVWTNNGASLSRIIPAYKLEKLIALSRTENATLFMTLLTAFKILLYKYSNQPDISIGTPIANRTRKEVESIIGLFINTIVIKTDLSGNPTFRELLQRVKKITLEGYENQDLPFELLVEKLQPNRDMSYQPLFQVMFILQNIPMNSKELSGLTMSMINIDMGTSTYDITMTLAETHDGLDISVEYNTDLFDKRTIDQMLAQYESLLSNIILNPGEKINFLQLMEQKDRDRILYEWNKTQAFHKDECIHQLFERQAEQNSASIAAVFRDNSITYKELNDRANQLAHRLVKLGVGPETIVGICIERSLEMLVTVLGVSKSGGAYLPLDASYPEDRLAFMLKDANVRVLITQDKLLDIIPHHMGPVILVDKDWELIANESTANLDRMTDPKNLVYVIYTSGSTGKPKGTMISHASLVNAYLAWEEAYELRTNARCHLQMASFSFDVFAGDWTRALCSGGKLVIASREILLEGENLYELMKKEGVNIAEFVPAVLRNLIQYLEISGNNLNFMHLLIAGSDIWYVSEYKKFRKYCGEQTRLINSFGLTEATIDSSYYESNHLNISDEHLVPIGHPFANMTLFILDEFYQPLTVGLKGELYVGGTGLSRGYLNRPDITADKFIPNPFSLTPGERLYRTGDLARYLPDGNVEFLGRMDNQIKLRGLRVELGEIETALSEYGNIKDVAVIAREDVAGDKRIVAYLVANDNNYPKISELKYYLLSRMPEYMVPSAFVFLQKLPLTPNGKIDRRSLPAPDMEEIIREKEMNFVAPRTAVEEVIASIWSEVLNIEKIGVNDNFFDLGGHSLLATQVISRIRKAFNIDIPLRNIFEIPTIEGLARLVEKEEMKKAGLDNAVILPLAKDSPIPLSFAQERLWFLDQLEPESSFYNMPEAFRVKGVLNIGILEESLNELIRRHQILRTSFLTENGKPKVEVADNVKINIQVIDLCSYNIPAQEKLIQQISDKEVQTYIPLDKAPLFRALCIKLSAIEHIVIVVFHHIITDDWSSKIILREIAIIYDSISRQVPVSLPELKLQYSDYAYWQRKYLSGDNLQKQLDYWKNKLDACPALLELPTDRPRPAAQTFKGDYLSFEITGQLFTELERFNKKYGVTLFMSLLSVFQVLLSRLSGQDDFCVGTPIANRNRADIEGIIGFFVNTLVLRCKVRENMKFTDLLRETRESSLESFTYQDLPFEMLVDNIQPVRNLSHSPIFQVMFVLQNASQGPQQINNGLSMIPVEVHSKTSKFDLTMFVAEERERIGIALEYNSDLFDSSSILRFWGYFKAILEKILRNPEMEVAVIPLLSQEESQAIIQKINETAPVKMLDDYFHKQFEQKAIEYNEEECLRYKEERVSYRELNERSNRLSHYLIKKGIKAETSVGVMLDRSVDVIVAILGILKAGG